MKHIQDSINSGYNISFGFGVSNEYRERLNAPIGNAMSFTDIFIARALSSSLPDDVIKRRKEALKKESDFKKLVEKRCEGLIKLFFLQELKTSLWTVQHFIEKFGDDIDIENNNSSPYGTLTLNFRFKKRKSDIQFYESVIKPFLIELSRDKFFTISMEYADSKNLYYYSNDPLGVFINDESGMLDYVKDNYFTFIEPN